MVERNQSLSKHPTIEYRIGVNLGDVIMDPDDICGEGVHIASRLAAIAGPSQVSISGGIYEQIKHKLFYGYESLGEWFHHGSRTCPGARR
jgi:class 3 adenylate cyclase